VTLVFFYPQFKKLTGAERLILKLADYTARVSEGDVVLLTHRFAEECRPALSKDVRLIETGWRLQVTGNHYLDAALEYALGPALAMKMPRRDLRGVIFFGPPSVPAMWITKRLLMPVWRERVPVLYFCFEPPRFVYSDTADVAARVGKAGRALSILARLYRPIDRRLVRAADRVLSNSPYGARRIRQAYGVSATVIEHGVDFPDASPEDVEALRARYKLEGRPVAVTVNHLHPRKRIDLFLRSVYEASKEAPGAVALVVGAGPEEKALKSLASELGMEVGKDAIFTGGVPEAELPAHFRLGNVYVHTGRQESFGLSVIEALYSGLPVVSVNEGGPCDTVQHGVSGYLVPAEPEVLGSAISRLLADPALARGMGEAGSRFVSENFRWERGADTLRSVLSATGKRKRAAAPARRSA
jgi:glycosyltransferase involved in cell wall biosynthesis